MRIIGIQESDGVSKWEVLAETPDGAPLKVQAVHPAERGSFLEAALNTALAAHSMRRALWKLLPPWVFPEPKKFWSETR